MFLKKYKIIIATHDIQMYLLVTVFPLKFKKGFRSSKGQFIG